ncbi:Putative esterase [Phycisphaerae bacterium RAS2]|nr:Putative esterase [Phycisphaerae bacterium RAS2]
MLTLAHIDFVRGEPTPATQSAAAARVQFTLTFDRKLKADAFTGRIILYLDTDLKSEPRLGYSWTTRRPVFGHDVTNWKPGKPITIQPATGYPHDLADLPPGRYVAQAVMHTNPDVPHSGDAPGNLYSKPVEFELADDDTPEPQTVTLKIRRRVKHEEKLLDTPTMKSIKLRSALLSKFHKRDVYLRAVVELPKEYAEQADRRFPAVYVIPGFGGDHFQTAVFAGMMLRNPKTPFVRVSLDATCPLGHHVFADSDNNGPYGAALVEELIPWLEKEYRLIPEPTARLLTGHSSGGWSTLWLQVNYPDTFGGTWSTSPDPVTFADFTGVNLYDPMANFYTDAEGESRPIMRQNGRVILLLRDFVQMEDAIGPGGQVHSFEAVFSPRGPDGRPRLVFDRKTGAIDAETVKAWRRKYDIVEKLQREWPTLGPKLKGKITVIMGEDDNFYLAGAAHRLKDTLAELDSDARVIIEPGKDHGTIMMTKPFQAIMSEMCEEFLAAHPQASENDDQP